MAKLKTMQVEEVKTTSSNVDKSKTHDSENAKKLRAEKVRKDPKKYISHHHGHGVESNKVVVKKDGLVAYVDRVVANKLVKSGKGYSFAKKSEWKKLVRDAKEPKELNIV